MKPEFFKQSRMYRVAVVLLLIISYSMFAWGFSNGVVFPEALRILLFFSSGMFFMYALMREAWDIHKKSSQQSEVERLDDNMRVKRVAEQYGVEDDAFSDDEKVTLNELEEHHVNLQR